MALPKNYCRVNYRKYNKGFAKSGRTRVYACWISMRNRCNNPNHAWYHRYGGRGIQVCERWNLFDNFFDDMGHAPPGLSLEREDNDKNYSPDNCCWASQEQQCNNRSSNVMLTFEGKTLSIRQWSRKIGITHATIERRIANGWPIDMVLSPNRHHRGVLNDNIRRTNSRGCMYYIFETRTEGRRVTKTSKSLKEVLAFVMDKDL